MFCISFYEEEEERIEQIERYLELEEEAEEESFSVETIELSERTELKKRMEDIMGSIGYIDEKLSEVTTGWSLKRIGRVELSILRIACYEMKFDSNIVANIAINEAVELAKKYAGDEAHSFVNGVLAKLV
jgi:transcription antitermination factor nusB